jgi:hypothetical protein
LSSLNQLCEIGELVREMFKNFLERDTEVEDRNGVPFPVRSKYPRQVRMRVNMDPRYEENRWARLLAYVTGLINQELLLKNEYLAAENRILRAHLPAQVRLSDPERSTLAEIGKRLGRKALAEVACVVKPDTILAWYLVGLLKRDYLSRFCTFALQDMPPINRRSSCGRNPVRQLIGAGDMHIVI